MWAMAGSAPGSGYLACDGAVSRRWWFAAAMGLVTATFSTIAVVLGAGRFGRDVDLSWMEVGMVLLREAGISATPTAGEVAAGLAVHVFADFFWALVFFGVLGPWTRRLGPLGLLAGALPWALATAAVEYYAVLPWLAMQTPYWVAAMVHTASALAYPLAFWLAGSLLGDRRWSGFGRGHAVVLGLAITLVGALAALGAARQEPALPWTGRLGGSEDARFPQHMAQHHDVGVELAELAAGRADDPRMRALGRLMVAEQQAEAESLRRWWENLYGSSMPAMAQSSSRPCPGCRPVPSWRSCGDLPAPPSTTASPR
jgi:hypothetical protein